LRRNARRRHKNGGEDDAGDGAAKGFNRHSHNMRRTGAPPVQS
jgi:hypothetical protein